MRESALRLAASPLKDLMMTLRPLPPKKSYAAVLIAASLCLSACGIKGDLETPPPIWGDGASETQPAKPESSS